MSLRKSTFQSSAFKCNLWYNLWGVLREPKFSTLSFCSHPGRCRVILHLWSKTVMLQESVKQKPRPQIFPPFIYLYGLIQISLNLVMRTLYQTTDEGFYNGHEKPSTDENCSLNFFTTPKYCYISMKLKKALPRWRNMMLKMKTESKKSWFWEIRETLYQERVLYFGCSQLSIKFW